MALCQCHSVSALHRARVFRRSFKEGAGVSTGLLLSVDSNYSQDRGCCVPIPSSGHNDNTASRTLRDDERVESVGSLSEIGGRLIIATARVEARLTNQFMEIFLVYCGAWCTSSKVLLDVVCTVLTGGEALNARKQALCLP